MEAKLKKKIGITLIAGLVLGAGYVVLSSVLYPKITVIEKEKIVYRPTVIQIDLEMFHPKNNEVLTLNQDESIKFFWNKLDQGTTYHLVVKSDQEAPRSFNLDKNEVTLHDFKGSVFEWSLSSDSKNFGKKSISGNFALNRKEVERLPASEPVVEAIAQEKGFKLEEKNIHLKYPANEVSLSWHGNQEDSYRFLVTNIKSGRNVVDEQITGLKRVISFTNPANYKISLMKSGDTEVIDSLDLKFEKPVGAFNPVRPVDFLGKTIQINFNLNQKENVLLEVYNKEKNEKVGNFQVKGEAHRFQIATSGHFCFKLKGQNKTALSESNPICADIKLPAERKIASIQDLRPPSLGTKILNYYQINGRDTYQFDLPLNVGASEYQLRIFNDKETKELLREVSLKNRRVFWKTQRESKTYVKYRIKNSSGEFGEWSETGELIFPISPLEFN